MRNAEGKHAAGRSAWFRGAFLIIFVLAGVMALRWSPLGDFVSEDRLLALLQDIRGIWWAPLALLALYALLAPFGVTMVPLLVAGAAFGPLAGSVYNTTGLLVGALVNFWLARNFGRQFVARALGPRGGKLERFSNRHGFWPLVQARFMPLPTNVVDFGAALAGVVPGRFVLAAVVGLVPSTVIHSYFIASLMEVQGSDRLWYGLAYGATFIIFNLLIGIPWLGNQRQRRARYRNLLEQRRKRQDDPVRN
jgi:uncharacterized membrane protein YdjX (TVP38/TMEM64 family)